MKALLPILLAVPLAAFGQAQSFPPPLTAERAVSDVVNTGAAGRQMNPRVATNGDITLVVWTDEREGKWSIYGARVDASGNVLDPLGVRITDGFYLDGIAWNGQSFVVVVLQTMTFVSPDLTAITTKRLDSGVAAYHFATMTPGPDVRFLFMSVGSGSVAIIDGRGEVVGKRTLWTDLPGRWASGVNENSFLVIRKDNPYGTQTHTVAFRLDRNGNLLSTAESGLPIDEIYEGEPIAGGSDGFLMIHVQGVGTIQTRTISYRLDSAGVYVSSSVLANGIVAPLLQREGEGYLAVWVSDNPAGGNGAEVVANIHPDNTVTVRSERVLPYATGLSLASSDGRRWLAVSLKPGGLASNDDDVYIQSLPDTLQPGAPQLVSFSGTRQNWVGVAATANGYAVTWVESGPDSLAHTYVRRFSDTGTPLDAPLEIFSGPRSPSLVEMRATIVSNADTYLVAWKQADAFVIRRLDARVGSWIDPAPVPLGLSGRVAFASNGTDAMALALETRCGNANCLSTRRIALTGAPLTAPLVTVRTMVPPLFAGDAGIGTNGADYLAVWTESEGCPFECGGYPGPIYATRLRSDGTTLDAQPLRLTTNSIYASNFTIASTAGRYLVAWADPEGVTATRITAEGALVDADTAIGGVRLATYNPGGNRYIAGVAARGAQFVLLLDRTRFEPLGIQFSSLEGVTFAANDDLHAVAALPRTTLVQENTYAGTFALVARGATLAAAYGSLSRGDAGGVSRAYLRLFAEPITRRRATR